MNRSIRLLLVEDNPVDAELMLRELRRAGYDLDWKRVETEAAFVEQLQAGVDLVISDYSMPRFSGMRALELRNRSGLDVPFILVSGTIGEDVAVEAMKRGASDYLMKDRPTRLGSAVEHALNECRLRGEKRLADAELVSSERHYRLLFESNPESMWVYDLETLGFLAVNAAATDHYGFTRDEFLAMTTKELRPLETLIPPGVKLRTAVAGRSGPTAWRHRKKDGTLIEVEVTTNNLVFAGRSARLVLATDVTERKRVEESLRLFRALMDRSMESIEVIDPVTAQILDANEHACISHGYTREEYLELTVFDLAVDVSRATFDESVRRLRASRGYVFNGEHRRKDGSNFPVEIGLNWVSLDRDYLVAVVRDVTEQKKAEKALRESEEWFRGLIENATDLITVVDVTGCIKYHSPSALRLLGYSPGEVLGKCVTDFIHPDDAGVATEGIGRAFANTAAKTIEYRIRNREGQWRLFQSIGRLMPELSGRKLIVVNSRDVTETRELELQFLRAQRVEAIGTLSAGIAHDLNNILTPMLMATGLLRGDIEDPRSRELLMMIETGAQRGASIIRQLLTFSRGIEGERVSVQWRHLIKEMADIARETFPRAITISEHVSRDLHLVSADATQLHQVLLNFCINARDAMPSGGKLTLQARDVELVAGKMPAHPAAKPGQYVLMEVADTGTGIPPGVIDRIFDPFFTTKEIGKGTGLGLSTALGIVKSHGGFITVQSSLGKGTTFQVFLPAESAVESVKQEAEVAPARGQRELILLVDDEAAIRLSTTAALEHWNYRVVSAANGEAALTLFQKHRDEVKLVVTDLMMPVMDGQVLIQALRVLAPELRIMAATGLDPGEKRANLRALGVSTILMKPYSPQSLIEAVVGELRESGR